MPHIRRVREGKHPANEVLYFLSGLNSIVSPKADTASFSDLAKAKQLNLRRLIAWPLQLYAYKDTIDAEHAVGPSPPQRRNESRHKEPASFLR